MRRSWWSMMMALVVLAPRLTAQEVQFPDTPQGKLAAGFFAAANATDEEAMLKFHLSFYRFPDRLPDRREIDKKPLTAPSGA